MNIDPEVCFRALAARDPRFDGLFVVGVTTTGIYCRPVCTARTPGRDRCRFFAGPPQAEREGFRPCLRCRPELAPGHAPCDAVRTLARRAADRIEAGALADGGRLDELAAGLGISTRQLRRAFQQEFGVSPVELAQTRRLLLAKQLLTETNLPITRVAFASGFSSVRRFNSLVRAHYRLTPTRIRNSARGTRTNGAVCLTLAYRPPYCWDALLAFLAARATPGVECVTDGAYIRTAAFGSHTGWIKVEPMPGRNALRVSVATSLVPALAPLLAGLRRLFDLDARPDVIAAHLAHDRRLAPLVRRACGLRLPGAIDPFEVAVRAILGQRVSVRAATTISGRIADAFGTPVDTPYPCVNRLAPTPEHVASTNARSLAALGLPETRAHAVIALSQAVVSGAVDLSVGGDAEATIEALVALPGIGPWTAHYIAMRGLHWPDAFPAGDLILRRALTAQARADAWRPWRAYAAMHLWNESSHVQETSDE
jgi:AraC family transcriptional regulator of adaptative response / DNA-3-methyladenine glycosylase II